MKRGRPEVLSTIVYADGETVERKELTAIPNSLYQYDKNKRVTESNFGTNPNISVAKNSNRKKYKFGAASADTSEITNFPSTSDSEFSITRKPAVKKSEKTILLSLIEQLEMRKCISSSVLKSLKENCLKIKDFDSIFVLLKDMLKALNLPTETSVVTRSRSNPTEEAARSLLSKNKALEERVKGFLMNIRSLDIEFRRKEEELRRLRNVQKNLEVIVTDLKRENVKLKNEIGIGEDKYKNLRELLEKKQSEINAYIELNVADIQRENEKLKEEIGIGEDKYKNLIELLEKKNSEIKRLQFLYQGLIKETNERMAIGCNDCKKLKKKVNELQTISDISERQMADLKFRNEDLDKKEDYARNEVEKLETEVKELKFKLYTESIEWPKNKADRRAISSYYFSGNVPRLSLKKEDPNPKGIGRMEISCLTRCEHGYDKPSTSNSMSDCRRGSFHRSSFHTKSAEDNFNVAHLAKHKYEKNDSSNARDCKSSTSHLSPEKKLKK